MPDSRVGHRYVWEVVVIVGSILLAFAIDAAWDQRADALAERELVASLRTEFEFQRSELIRNKERWEQVAAASGRLLEAASTGVIPPAPVTDSLMSLFLFPGTFDPRKGTLSAATASGTVALIGNQDIRDRLSAWDGVVEEVRDNEVLGRRFIFDTLIPYLASAGAPLSRAWALVPTVRLTEQGPMHTWPGKLQSDADATRAYEKVLRDPRFEALAASRYSMINVGEYADALVFVDSLLRLLASESP